MNVKQVIVVRNDLRSKLKHGKLAAQVAHASMGAAFMKSYVTDVETNLGPDYCKCIPLDDVVEHWFNDTFTKVVLRCDDEQQLHELERQAKEAGLLHCLITDCGNTVFNEPTVTCLGIGPATKEQLDQITGQLKMY